MVFNPNGDTVAVWDTPFPLVGVPASAKTVPDREQRWSDGRVEIEVFDYPDVYPRVGRLLADRAGYLWVMKYPEYEEPTESVWLTTPVLFRVPEGGARWLVLGPDGTPLAEVKTPVGLYPIEIGDDYILGVVKDEYDVEEVRLYGLQRGTDY